MRPPAPGGPTRPDHQLSGPIIAVLRASDAADYRLVVDTLASTGITTIELTLTTPRTLEGLPRLRADSDPTIRWGVGTVLTPEQAHDSIAAGADFLVTPTTIEEVIDVAVQAGVPILPGGLTPSELWRGWVAGAAAVKLFPASTVGPEYLAHLRGPFPGLQVVPSGGIDIPAARRWIAAGASAVSVGGPLIGDALTGGSLTDLRHRAATLLDAVQKAAVYPNEESRYPFHNYRI